MLRTSVMVTCCFFVAQSILLSGCFGPFRREKGGSADYAYSGYRPDVGEGLSGTSRSGAEERQELEEGDQLLVRVNTSLDQMKVEDVVDERGSVGLPLIGDVTVAGFTTSEAEQAIYDRYVGGKIFRSVVVSVVLVDQTVPEEFFATGELNRKGGIPLRDGMTLTQAIAAAGDFTEWANQKRVRVTRDGQSTYHNVADIRRGEGENPIIRKGDQIHVERGF